MSSPVKNDKESEILITCPSCGYQCDAEWTFCISCGFEFSKIASQAAKGEMDKKLLSKLQKSVFGIETKHKDTTAFSFMTEREAKRVLAFLGKKEPDEAFYRSYRSGWLYDNEGHIVTSAKVLENVESIKIRTWSNEEREAKVVGYDLPTGIGVIKIDGELPKPFRLVDTDKCHIGEDVWIIGYPVFYRGRNFIQKLPEKVSKGTLTERNKTNINVLQIEDYFQSDIAPDSGIYGGPMINTNGEVIGMVTKSIDEGIGMANQVNLVQESVEKILKKESFTRGYLGIGISSATPFLREKFNISSGKALVAEFIVPSSPAEKAGLKKGDLILKVNGQSYDSVYPCQQEIMRTDINQEFQLTIRREKETLQFKIESDKRPKEIFLRPIDEIEQYYGIHLMEQTEGFITQQGMKIVNMLPGSLAESREFEIGDLIYKIDDTYMVLSEKDFNEVLEKITHDFRKKRYDKDEPCPYKTFKATFTIRKKDAEKKKFTYYSNYSKYYQPTVM
jgi:serine protease Do